MSKRAREGETPLRAMKGDGFYNANSSWQYKASLASHPLLRAAGEQLPSLNGRSHFNLVDIGCSQGLNSQKAVSEAIEGIRGDPKNRNLPICVHHCDLYVNDFNSLFKVLNDQKISYLAQHPHVFAYAQGRSFYEPLFPEDSCHLIFSLCAIHWLSGKPESTSVAYCSTSSLVSDTDRLAFSEWAHEDLCRFLRLRSKELVSEGKLVLSFVASDENMRSDSQIIKSTDMAIQKLLQDKLLTLEEATRFIVRLHYRSPSEAKKSFEACQDTLRLDYFSHELVTHPAYDDFQAKKISAEEYSKTCCNFFKAIVEPSILGCLDSQRTEAETDKISEALFDAIYQSFLESPDSCCFHMIYASLTKS